MKGWTARVLLGIGWLVLATAAWSAPDPRQSTDAVKKALIDVIDAQLAAFRADDYAKAYTFAASGFKSVYSVENFEQMVKTGYPVIAHSQSAEYGMAFDRGDQALVFVEVQGAADGKIIKYQYTLKLEDNAWKINGVSMVKTTGVEI